MAQNVLNRNGGYKMVSIVIIMQWKMKKADVIGFFDQGITMKQHHLNGFCMDSLLKLYNIANAVR